MSGKESVTESILYQQITVLIPKCTEDFSCCKQFLEIVRLKLKYKDYSLGATNAANSEMYWYIFVFYTNNSFRISKDKSIVDPFQYEKLMVLMIICTEHVSCKTFSWNYLERNEE